MHAYMYSCVSLGLCPGAQNIRCCKSGISGTDTPPLPTAQPKQITPKPYLGITRTVAPLARVPCNKGQAGACIETLTVDCAGTNTLAGFCPGAANVRCCPPPGIPAVYAQEGTHTNPCLTQQQLAAMWANNKYFATPGRVAELDRALYTFQINTAPRIRHFMAQISYESGEGKYLEEIWGPSSIQLTYEGRTSLGNLQQGDGFRFRGGGYIQLTGRSNYQAFATYIGDGKVMDGATYVAAQYPATASGFWWMKNSMNSRIDAGATGSPITKYKSNWHNIWIRDGFCPQHQSWG